MLKTILIVDDDHSMRELLRLHLSAAGYAVTCAASGAEAIQAVRGVTPDLIICDVHMPRMNGFELIAALKPMASLAQTPVIFLTVDEDARDRGAQLGAVDCLTKPIRVEALLEAVAKHLPASV